MGIRERREREKEERRRLILDCSRSLFFERGYESVTISQIASAAGFDRPPIHEAARPGDVMRSVLDVAAAAQLIGWAPFTPLSDGVTRTVAWFRANG